MSPRPPQSQFEPRSGVSRILAFQCMYVCDDCRSPTVRFCALRSVTDCGDNGQHHDLVVRRSTDLGKTWGPMIVVREGSTPCSHCPAAISNPNPVEVTMPSGQKRVLLHYDTMNNPKPDRHGVDMQVRTTRTLRVIIFSMAVHAHAHCTCARHSHYPISIIMSITNT